MRRYRKYRPLGRLRGEIVRGVHNQKGGLFKLPPNVKHEVTVDRNDRGIMHPQ